MLWRFGEWMLEHVHIVVYTGVVIEAICLVTTVVVTYMGY